MKTNTESFHGLVAMVCDVPTGMSAIKKLETAKAVVRHIAPKVRHEWLLLRIASSRFPTELLTFLPEVYGIEHRKILPFVEAMVKVSVGLFEDDDLEMFADRYWSLVVRERIVRGDYRRAWDEIRKSLRGFRPHAYTWEEMELGRLERNIREMGASYPMINLLTEELYRAMREKGLIEEAVLPPLTFRLHLQEQFSEAGALFVIATGNYNDSALYDPQAKRLHCQPITLVGWQMRLIASHFVQKRNKKRRTQTEQKLKAKT